MIYNTLRAVPFKSTWEGGTPFFFIFLLVVGVKPYFFYVGWTVFSIGERRGGSEISGVPPPRYI